MGNGILCVTGVWRRDFHGPWRTFVQCTCGAEHKVAEGGVGPAPRLRGGAIFAAPSCPKNVWGSEQFIRVSVRLNPLLGSKLSEAMVDMDRVAVALLEAADVTERTNERRELQEASRTIVGILGRVRFLHALATVHPDEIDRAVAGAST